MSGGPYHEGRVQHPELSMNEIDIDALSSLYIWPAGRVVYLRPMQG
ncbi:hypothetical protein VTO73DRAFT_2392 [Trametes versicolor]